MTLRLALLQGDPHTLLHKTVLSPDTCNACRHITKMEPMVTGDSIVIFMLISFLLLAFPLYKMILLTVLKMGARRQSWTPNVELSYSVELLYGTM